MADVSAVVVGDLAHQVPPLDHAVASRAGLDLRHDVSLASGVRRKTVEIKTNKFVTLKRTSSEGLVSSPGSKPVLSTQWRNRRA